MDVNPAYKDPETIRNIQAQFAVNTEFPSISLQAFLDVELFAKLQQEVNATTYTILNQPLKCRLGHAQPPPSMQLIQAAVNDMISKVLGPASILNTWNLYSVSHRQYWLRSPINVQSVEAIFSFTPHWNDECGGRVIYADDQGNYHHLLSTENTVSLVQKPAHLSRFIEYVNAKASDKRQLLLIGTV